MRKTNIVMPFLMIVNTNNTKKGDVRLTSRTKDRLNVPLILGKGCRLLALLYSVRVNGCRLFGCVSSHWLI